jgi:hypothetical protein
MPSYITQHSLRLRQYHYIQTATTRQRWFNFSKRPLSRYIREFGDDFCLVINCSRQWDEAYILPFGDFKDLFVPASMIDERRWEGGIVDDCIRLSPVEKNFEKFVGTYLNAFHSLRHAPLPLPQAVDFV